MRPLASAALHSAVLTLTALVALRAADPALAVAAVAAVAGLLAWYATLSSTEEASGLDVAGTLPGVALGLVRRASWGNLLPMLAAQAVVAVGIGAAAKAFEDDLGPTLLVGSPSLAAAGAVGLLVGVVTAWVVLAVDGNGPAALGAVPALLSGGLGSIGLLAAFHPAATLGLATAGMLTWPVAGTLVAAALAGTVLGSYAVSLLLPQQE
ncbi:MAG: hypothetical protein QM621_10335 [Aeromicrobium sp.]|uniref:hypothetical protein n=1 Tax=Aeromicrobium sp. TaxID=1871063 RepID=UPI0039E46648